MGGAGVGVDAAGRRVGFEGSVRTRFALGFGTSSAGFLCKFAGRALGIMGGAPFQRAVLECILGV